MLRKVLKSVLTSTTHSTMFLSCAATTIIVTICLLRRLLGTVYVASIGALPGLAATWGLEMERPTRRRDFAVYTSNVAVRILFRKLQQDGVVRAIPGGERLVAAAALYSLLTAQTNHWQHQGKMMRTLLQVVVHDDERKPHSSRNGSACNVPHTAATATPHPNTCGSSAHGTRGHSNKSDSDGDAYASDATQEQQSAVLGVLRQLPLFSHVRASTRDILARLCAFQASKHRLCSHNGSCALSIADGVWHGTGLAVGALLVSLLSRALLKRGFAVSAKVLIVLLTTTPIARFLRCFLRQRHNTSAATLRRACVCVCVCVPVYVYKCVCESETDRQTDRQTDREGKPDQHTHTLTHTHTHTHTHTLSLMPSAQFCLPLLGNRCFCGCVDG